MNGHDQTIVFIVLHRPNTCIVLIKQLYLLYCSAWDCIIALHNFIVLISLLHCIAYICIVFHHCIVIIAKTAFRFVLKLVPVAKTALNCTIQYKTFPRLSG